MQQYVNKDINPSDPTTVGGNRDVLDFPLFFALQNNLTSNGLQNNWFNVVNASQDSQDDGLANNGSEGVSFVSSADNGPPALDNVAYAYTLTHPGNTIVYFNGHEFGNNRSFPADGRGDALGGQYGDTITNLVNIRDTHPDGNYDQRYIDNNVLVYERDDSMLVGLNNRNDSGYDTRTVHTDFAPGTYLVDLTGFSASSSTNEDGNIKPLLQVNSDGNVTFEVPRNMDDGNFTGDGYVIYAPASPQGSLTITNVDHVIPGDTPTPDTNGTARLSPIDVVTGDTFQLQLNTNNVNLLGDPTLHDQDANSDNALFKIDGGVDVTGNGFVDTNPGDVTYGFQQFTTVHNPGFLSSDGNGQYAQTIDTSELSNGYHYVDVRAFRHRNDGEPSIFTDFKVTIYVDHSPTVSKIVSFNDVTPGNDADKVLTVQSTDLRANNVHVFFDLPAALSDSQVLSMVGSGSQSTQIDRDLWTKEDAGLTSSNHVATVVSYQVDGNANVQRFPGLATSTPNGSGMGDLDDDGKIDANDVNLFAQVLESNGTQFNAAADFNGDGIIDNSDLLLFYPALIAAKADAATLAAYFQLLGPIVGGYTINEGSNLALSVNQPSGTTPPLRVSWDLNSDGTFGDATGASPTVTWAQLVALGIANEGTYPIGLQVTDGTNTIVLPSTLVVQAVPPTLSISGPGEITEGNTYTLGLAASEPGGDTITSWSINWGDGSTQTVSGNPSSVTHVFTAPPDKLVILATATDEDATYTANFLPLTVADALLTPSGLTFSPVEAATFSGAVATFTDDNSFAQSSSFSASIDWGDGATTAGTVTTSGDGPFTVFGTHAYAEEGSYAVSPTIVDPAGQTVTATSTALVSDASVLARAAPQSSATEGVMQTFKLAIFTDPAGTEEIGDYSAVIDWGDGTVSTLASILHGDGGFTVSGTHTYAEEGTWSPVITLSHDTSTPVAVTATIIASDPSVIATAATLTAVEGASQSFNVAAFTDPAGAEAIGDYSATIDWGDGTLTTNASISLNSGVFTVSGTHGYAEEGTNSPVVTIAHDTSVSVTATASIAVSDAAVVATPATLSAIAGDSQTFNVATFTDPAGAEASGNYSAAIDWGDGTVTNNASIAQNNGIFTVSGTHIYAEAGTASPVVTIAHDTSGSVPVTGSVAVSEAVIVATPAMLSATEGAPQSFNVATFTVPTGAESTRGFSASIDWGDGSVASTASISLDAGVFTVSATHTYAEEGTDAPIVTITHNTVSVTTTASIAVSDPAVTATAATLGAVEGDSQTFHVATFTDPAGAEAIGDYSATIDWGDGTVTNNASIAQNDGIFTVSGTHAYAEEGTKSPIITIAHDTSASVTTTASIVVSDLAVTATAATLSAVEGTSHAFNLATFTDPAGAEQIGDYDATINWGDGSVTNHAPIALNAGVFTVGGTHTYAEEGTKSPVVTIAHDTAASITATASVVVSDTAVVTTPVTLSGVEGTSQTFDVATFIDPAGAESIGDYSATINWGDGSVTSNASLSLNAGVFTVSGTHTYAEEGTNSPIATISHDTAASVTITASVAVTDANLVATAATLTATEGAAQALNVATFTDSGGAEPISAYSATIDWGDGSLTSNASISFNSGVFTVSGTHTYAEEAQNLPVRVILADEGGSQRTAFGVANVADAKLHISPATLTIPPGNQTSNLLVATFVDDGGAELATSYRATIDWGDGVTTAGSVARAHTGANVFQITASHAYASAGKFNVGVSIEDEGGSTDALVEQASVQQSPNQAYVSALYEKVLGRSPESGGLEFWTQQLDNGTPIGTVAATFAHSGEYYTNQVIKPEYLKVFGRLGDDAGVQYWTRQMLSGLTDQQLEADFAASNEFFNAAGGQTNAVKWIDAVYKLLLGQTADPGGEVYWNNQLITLMKTEDALTARQQVALGIVSHQDVTSIINEDYFHLLGRAPDPTGLAHWLKQFADGKLDEDILAVIAGSPEFYNDLVPPT